MWSAQFNSLSRGYDVGESHSENGDFRAVFGAESEIDAAYRIHLLNGGSCTPEQFVSAWDATLVSMFRAS